MKKQITAIAALMMCIGTAANAETVADVVNNNGRISVTGKTVADTTVTLIVENAEVEDDFYAFKETVSDSEGKFSFDFTLRDPEVQEDVSSYVVKIKGDGVYTKDIAVFSDAVKDSVMAEINDGDKAVLEGILSDDDKRIILENQGFDLAGYDLLSDGEKADVCKNFYTDKENYAEAKTQDIFNAEVAVILSKDASEDEYSEILAKVDSVGIEFTKASDFVKDRLMADNSYDSLLEFNKKFDEFTAVEKVNNARYSDMEEIFEDNSDLLGLEGRNSYKKYLSMNETNKRKVNQAIVSAIKKSPAENADDVCDVLDDAVSDIKTSTGGSGGGGGGSSSGGGSSYPGGAGTTTDNTSFTLPSEDAITVVEEKTGFTDIDDDFWAKEYIEKLSENDVVNGYDDGSFKPQKTITREEFITMAVKAFDIKTSGAKCDFADVSSEKWYYEYVAACFEKGIVKGISETEFGIGRNITRQDAALIISKLITLSGADGEKFADDEDISEYAYEAVYALKNNGILSGNTENKFNPKNSLTRAECAVIISKALEK